MCGCDCCIILPISGKVHVSREGGIPRGGVRPCRMLPRQLVTEYLRIINSGGWGSLAHYLERFTTFGWN